MWDCVLSSYNNFGLIAEGPEGVDQHSWVKFTVFCAPLSFDAAPVFKEPREYRDIRTNVIFPETRIAGLSYWEVNIPTSFSAPQRHQRLNLLPHICSPMKILLLGICLRLIAIQWFNVHGYTNVLFGCMDGWMEQWMLGTVSHRRCNRSQILLRLRDI